MAVYAFDGGAVNLQQIPFAAIERVEVLREGASAIYGTDAVAGVINFITRKDYQGFNIGANYHPQQSGGKLYIVDASGGYGSLAKDGWNVFGGVTYRKQDALKATDRDFASSAVIPDKGASRRARRRCQLHAGSHSRRQSDLDELSATYLALPARCFWTQRVRV